MPTLSSAAAAIDLQIVLEVVLIGVGVFLGLAGEQWRETGVTGRWQSGRYEDFAGIVENRNAVVAVKDTMSREI